jgi:Protein of unknown function (DUF2845)
MNRLNLILLMLCLLFSSPLYALRCGRSLVQAGDYKDYITDICGEPTYVASHYERRGNINRADFGRNDFNNRQQFPDNSVNIGNSNYAEIEILVEEWYYDFGSSRLNKLLRFENGRLKEIRDVRKRRR